MEEDIPNPQNLLVQAQLQKLALEIEALERAAKNPDTDRSKNEDPVVKAQLRKLALEIEALETTVKEAESLEETKAEKLKLEVKTLAWQTGRVYRLSQFAVIFSIIATLVTVFATTYGIWASYRKDIENREKELTQKTDTLYRTELQRLIQFPGDPKMPIPEAVFLLRDIEEVVKNGYKDEQYLRQKEEVGVLLMQLIKSTDTDLSLPRNIEFDRSAIMHSTFYVDYLVRDPLANSSIISRYKNHLMEISNAYPDFKVEPDTKDDYMFRPANLPSEAIYQQYVYTYLAYKAHVDLLKRTAEEGGNGNEKAEKAKEYYNTSFCWFFNATRSKALTAKIYGGEPAQVDWKSQQCEKD